MERPLKIKKLIYDIKSEIISWSDEHKNRVDSLMTTLFLNHILNHNLSKEDACDGHCVEVEVERFIKISKDHFNDVMPIIDFIIFQYKWASLTKKEYLKDMDALQRKAGKQYGRDAEINE